MWDFKNMSGSFTVELRKLSRKFAISKLEVGREAGGDAPPRSIFLVFLFPIA